MNEHLSIINMIWEYILGDTLSADDLKREELHKLRCKKKNIPYSPRASIPFERFQSVMETVTDIANVPETKPNAMLSTILDVFEWFDCEAQGTLSYKQFQQRMGEFFFQENSGKKGGKKKGKKKGKGRAKKKGNKNKK